MKRAFTLAEVLITLGIIGIVAAMTMPMLLANTREKEMVSKLKKAYTNVSQAFQRAIVENNTPNYWNLGEEGDPAGAISLQDKLSEYFMVSKDCQTDGGCWPNTEITKLDGTSIGLNLGTDTSFATFRIADGTLYAFRVLSADCDADLGDMGALKKVCAEMYVDVNGERNPNRMGYDVFKFYIVKNGIYPAGLSNDTTTSFEDECLRMGSGLGCAAWVIDRANMDYLHCSDIGWDGKASCKNIFNYNHSTGM